MTSGTVTFNPDFGLILDEAFERAGLGNSWNGWDVRTARVSLSLLQQEWSNRGLNSWTVDKASIALVPGVAEYGLPADTVDVLDGVIRTGAGTTQSDISITRESFTTYQQYPNKAQQGRPVNFFVLRGTSAVTVTFWQVPDAVVPYTFVYYRLRRMQDVGGFEQGVDVPIRFMEALIAGLAARLAQKRKPELFMALKQEYEYQFDLACQGDVDACSIRIMPYLSI